LKNIRKSQANIGAQASKDNSHPRNERLSGSVERKAPETSCSSEAPADSVFPPSSRTIDRTLRVAPSNLGGLTIPQLSTAYTRQPESTPPTHDYEPLVGGTGKEVYFRQARYAMADLLGEHQNIEHCVEFDSRSGSIINYGINGVAFSLAGEAPPKDGVLQLITIKIGEDLLYRGRASVRYCRREANALNTVGVVLLDGILDTDAMIMAKNRALASKTAAMLTLALRADVSRHYKEAMADLVLLLSSYRDLLGRQESSIKSLSTTEAQKRAEAELLDIAVAEFAPQYDRYRKLCNEFTANLSKEMKRAYRQYTEAVLHPYILGAPRLSR